MMTVTVTRATTSRATFERRRARDGATTRAGGTRTTTTGGRRRAAVTTRATTREALRALLDAASANGEEGARSVAEARALIDRERGRRRARTRGDGADERATGGAGGLKPRALRAEVRRLTR